MQQVDTILLSQIILTMDSDRKILLDGAIAIKGDQIVAVDERDQIFSDYKSKDQIDFGSQLLMPGLVNAHTHVPMTLLRGLADDLRLDVWLLGYVMPVEREFVTPDFCRLGTYSDM
jgi:5-methylthioadenosine/S-adenosylhomocysteine deaminase